MRNSMQWADGLQAPTGLIVSGTNPSAVCPSDNVDSQRKDLSELLFTGNDNTSAAALISTYYARIYSPSSRLRIGISAGITDDQETQIFPTSGQLTWMVRPYAWVHQTQRYMPLQPVVASGTDLPNSWEAESAARMYVVSILSANLDLTGKLLALTHWYIAVNVSWEPTCDVDQKTLQGLFNRCSISSDGPKVTSTSP